MTAGAQPVSLPADKSLGQRAGATTLPILGIIIPKMGTISKAHARSTRVPRLASVLFTPVQQRVLGLLFGQPDRRFQSGELIRIADSGTGAVHRLLTRLAGVGLVTVERIGNQKHYQANRTNPVFKELCGIVDKTIAPSRRDSRTR